MKVVILSDIHANFNALQKVLKIIDSSGYDMMIILGDILTYGVDIDQVIQTIGDRIKDNNTLLIRGNHDEIYDDIFDGNQSKYIESLPDWLRESVNFTVEKLDKSMWKNLNFLENHIQDGIFYGHANPFTGRNWSYLNNSSKLEEASKTLKEMGLKVGIFGHLHRILNSTFSEKNILKTNTFYSNSLSNKEINILNTGSVGQPRDKTTLKPSFLWLNVDSSNVNDLKKYKYQIEFFDYPLNEHLKSIQNSSMSLKTKEKLLSFFKFKK